MSPTTPPSTYSHKSGYTDNIVDEAIHEQGRSDVSTSDRRLLDQPQHQSDLNTLKLGHNCPALNPVMAGSPSTLECLCIDPRELTGERVNESMRQVEDEQLLVKPRHEDAQLRKVSVIDCLPLEVLSEIFFLCLPVSTFIQPSTQQGPLLFNQVCSLWRQVCISSPRLWGSLCTMRREIPAFDSGTPPSFEDISRKDRNWNALVSLWISRSRDIPMQIRAKLAEGEADEALWDIIQSAHRRWQKVDFDLSDITTYSIDPFEPGDEYPLLKSICIRDRRGVPWEAPESWSTMSNKAPMLHDFAWELPRSESIPFQRNDLQLNWAKLTRLVLYHPLTAQECFNILSSTPHIVSVTFQRISFSSEVVFATLCLPFLTSIGVTVDYTLTPQFLFDTLTLPALKDLLVNCHGDWDRQSFMGFINRSKCRLESLNFYYLSITEDDLMDYLSMHEGSLAEVTIQGPRGYITDRMLERLTDNGVDPVWCPNLQIVALYEALNCSPGSVAQMARSRLDTPNRGPTLRRKTLRIMEFYSNEIEVEQMKELKDHGLVLILYDQNGERVPFTKDDMERLRQYQKEGLVLHSYASQIGFGPTESEDVL
ncbi:hypothetical protein CVT24_007131 [Panaeolus cyanescens]|uniref:F-box domain-containing protein n=1 Tax=Panaeolus cyanescens TaxID=181874 RepID=A0A409VJY3_9AGAR|nr:hypothetical protein CVT24_007131 [Panaeolus cyanescens]